MDFNQAIKISTGSASSAFLNLNSITSSPPANKAFNGYVTENVSFANARVGGFIDPLAQRDGAEADIALMGVRSIQLLVQVYGSSSGAFYDNINTINGALQPYPAFASSTDGFRALDFYEPTISYSTYTATGIPVRLMVRPTALPVYNINNNMLTPRSITNGLDRGLVARFSVNLIAKDPRKISQSAVSVSFSSASATKAILNNGNYNAYPSFTLTSTSAQTVKITGSGFTTGIALTANSATVVDSTLRTVTVGGTMNMAAVTSVTTSFPVFPSGTNNVTISPGTWTGLTVSCSYNEAWI